MNESGDMFSGSLPNEISSGDLARITGYTTRRIRQLEAEGLRPVARGRYNLEAAVKFMAQRKVSNRPVDDQRTRLLTAQAHAAEIKNNEKLKILIPVDIVSNVLNQVGVIIASQLEAIAPRLANELTNQDDPAYVKSKLEAETRQTRVSIARLFDNVADGSGISVDYPTTTDTHSESMGGSGKSSTT